MYTLWDKKSIPQPEVHQDEEEQLLDELANETKETLDTAKRMQLQLTDSIALTKNMNQLTDKRLQSVQDLKERTEIEGGKSSGCSLF